MLAGILFPADRFPQKAHWCNCQVQNKAGRLLYWGLFFFFLKSTFEKLCSLGV